MDSGEGPVCPPVVLVAVDVSPAEVVELVSVVVLIAAPVVVTVDVTAEEVAVVTLVALVLLDPVVLGPPFVVAAPTFPEPVVEEVALVVAPVLPVVALLVVLGSGVALSPDEQLAASTNAKPHGWFPNRFNERAFIVV